MGNWWEHEEEQTIDAEKQAALEQFETRQKKQYRTGKILVYLIVGIHILFRIVSWLISDFKPLGFVVTFLLAAGLVCGVSWVRYLYIVGDVLSILLMIVAIPALVSLEPPLPLAPVLILVVIVVYLIVDIVLMAASKSIKEYMYQRRNG